MVTTVVFGKILSNLRGGIQFWGWGPYSMLYRAQLTGWW